MSRESRQRTMDRVIDDVIGKGHFYAVDGPSPRPSTATIQQMTMHETPRSEANLSEWSVCRVSKSSVPRL